ncbi:MAG: YfhO family protein, partial [Endomicrobia bacterium]|nr:YfhO family protein [Endomicrobiia bacterium]
MLQFKPWKTFIQRCISNFSFSSHYTQYLPLWNPYNHCGIPIISNPQAQIFYPLSIIFYFVKNFVVGYKVFILFHLILAGYFMFILMEKKNFSFLSSLTSSIIWCLNGYIIARIEFLSVFASIIWLPLYLYILETVSHQCLVKNIFYFSFISALQFLSGHPQIWFYSITFVFFYSIYLTLLRSNRYIFFVVFFGVLLSYIITAIQLLPTLEFLFHSTRAGEISNRVNNGIKFGLKFEDASIFSLKFYQLRNLLYPFEWQYSKFSKNILELANYWVFTFYVGYCCIVLFVINILFF